MEQRLLLSLTTGTGKLMEMWLLWKVGKNTSIQSAQHGPLTRLNMFQYNVWDRQPGMSPQKETDLQLTDYEAKSYMASFL